MRVQQHYFTDDEEELIPIPADVLEQIDEQLGNRYKNRSEFIRAATMSYISTRNPVSTSPKKLQHVA